MTLNRISLIGRLGQDPTFNFTRTGTPVSKFSIATDHQFSNSDNESRRITTWFQIVAWAKTAENVSKHLTKGSRAYVEGRMQVRSWQDKNDNKRQTWEVVADLVIFLDAKPSESNAPQNPDADLPS